MNPQFWKSQTTVFFYSFSIRLKKIKLFLYLVTFYGWKMLRGHTHVSISFFCHQKWKVISRDHELWEVKIWFKIYSLQTLLSFFLVGLFCRPRYHKSSPWTGKFILWHRSTHKRVRAIHKWPNNCQTIENFTKSMI